MPKSKTDFTNFVDARPNYFPGQFLLEDDFEVEQKYLIDRQKYHRQSLHVSGIVEGLEVEVIKDKQEVQIKSGSAINSNGDLIILKKDTSFSKFAPLTNGELYISYKEEKQVKQQEDFTRWQEVPTIGFAATTPNDGVKLAKISIVNNVPNLDLTVRDYSGIFLPNATGNDLTLRSGGNANPNVAILNGSLTVTGTITGNIDATNINSGVLAVERIPNLPADKITSGTISGSLTVTNVLKIGQDATGGTRDWMTRGISILSDTDNLFIGLKDEGSNRKDAVIAWGDDPQDDLRFINVPSRGAANGTEIMRLKPSGNVGIGTETPSEKLEVSGNLRVTGTITGNINATNINAGVLDAARIANNSLSSDKIISLSADKITSGTISVNLSVTGALNADSLVLGPTNASNLRLGYHQDYSWIQSHGNKPLLINTSNNVGIGSTVNPIARLDISSASRTGTHPTAVKGLYITGDFNGDSDGVEFRHSNGSQGIGFGFNTIYAAGSNANQDLSLKPKGTGQVTVSGNLKVTGSLTAGGSDIYFTQTDHTHTGFGNTEGFAAIENASNHNALMILGRQTSTGRIIKVWDRFEVNGTFVNNSSQEHKQDITKLSNEDLNSILERLKQTPVFRYRFKTPGIDGKIRLGVIAEQSPEDILDESGKAVSFLDYNGFLLAALKAQQSLIENLQNDILLLQKR
jgi:cytoskeletal protein CcmA (bactofilin family)